MAKAFEEFDSFFKTSSKTAKTFVRGDTINPSPSGKGEEGEGDGWWRRRKKGKTLDGWSVLSSCVPVMTVLLSAKHLSLSKRHLW